MIFFFPLRAGVDPMERCNILAFTVHAGCDKRLFGEFCTNIVQYLLNLLWDTLFQTPRNKGVIYALCQALVGCFKHINVVRVILAFAYTDFYGLTLVN